MINVKENIFKNEIEKLNELDKEFNSFFDFEDFADYDEIKEKTKKLLPDKLRFRLKYLFYYFDYKKYLDIYEEKNNKFRNVEKYVEDYNKVIFEKLANQFREVCGLVENKELDNQQIESIVRKNRNQLVIAGAGSGKTTTIVGKVKYLLKTKQVNPEDILLLSFTNASASEMKERIKDETNVNLDVFTFHKLGLEIIKNSQKNSANIFNKDLYSTVKKILNSKLSDPIYFEKLIYFMGTARFDIKDEFEFKNETEYKEYLSNNEPITLKGEKVKSYGELEIANYLFSNNIEYEYEKEYKIDTSTFEYSQYVPDFYLPEYDIYIEYFGIDRNNKVAPYFKSKNGKSASEIYNDSIKWKRETHLQNKTNLIETFYYEKKENKLLKNLEKELRKYKVKIEPKTNEEIWKKINEENSGLFSEVCRVFETIINLIKSNDYSFEYLYSLDKVKNSRLNLLTLNLVEPIFDIYQSTLKEHNMIDFNDMINMATSYVEENKYIHNYKYVIVDEYQDISNARYRLLLALRKQKDFKLFCVGDDWQSIYRFNGSDIDLITNFEKYWGKTYISYIEKTYRFTSMMSKLSGDFIMKNRHQYRKKIDAKASEDFAISFVNGYTEKNCVDFLGDKLYGLERNSTVYFLGRYSFDIDILKKNPDYVLHYNAAENLTDIIFNKRKDLKIKFITIHKSKGLQADYVVILNNKNRGMGFPSKINDLPLIELLLASGIDDFKYSEERRLFYVALTRSKKKTFLLTIENNKSCFITELEEDYKEMMKYDREIKESIYKCPECGGRLVSRKSKYGPFLGCSNYPNCRYTKKY